MESIKVEEVKEPLKNRLGIIKISHRFIKQMDIDTLKAIYSVIVPLMSVYDNSRHLSATERFICYSELFDEVEEGVMYPEYIVTLQYVEGIITVKKVDKVDKDSMYNSNLIFE
jgi:hypothetical protein